LGCHHGDIGAWLLTKWALPPKLTEPIAEHHDFQPHGEYAQRTAAVHLADVLVRAEGFGGGDALIPQLAGGALDTLGLDLYTVERVMNRLNSDLSEMPRA